MSCESDSDGVISKRAKTKTGANGDEVEDQTLIKLKDNDASLEPDTLELRGKENLEGNDGIEKKRATKRSRESDVESSVTSDEDAMSKKRVRKDSEDEHSSKPRKFISAATRKRREAVRSAREKRVALESDSEDDSEQSFLVNRKTTGNLRSDSEKSVDSSESEETSDNRETKSQKVVNIDENSEKTNKLDSTQKNDDSSSAYNSDTDEEKKGNSVARKESSTSSKESGASSSEKRVACSPKRKSPNVMKSKPAEDKGSSSSEKDKGPCKKGINSDEIVENKTDRALGEDLTKDEPKREEKDALPSTDSTLDDEPLEKTKISDGEAQTRDHDSDSLSDSPLKIKKKHLKHPKSNSNNDRSSSDDSAPLKKTKPSDHEPKKTDLKHGNDIESDPAKKVNKIEGSYESDSGSDSEDEPLKKAKKCSVIVKKVKSEKPSEKKEFKRKSKASDQGSDSSSDCEESSRKSVARKTNKKANSVKVKDERESDSSEKERERASSISGEKLKLKTKSSEQKIKIKHRSSDSEDSEKETKSKGKGDGKKADSSENEEKKISSISDEEEKSSMKNSKKSEGKGKTKSSASESEGSGKENKSKHKGDRSESGEESDVQPKVKHEISSSDDSDTPLKKSNKTDKKDSRDVQKKSKKRSSSSDSSEKNDHKEKKKLERKLAADRKIEKMKKYVHTAGIRVANYSKLWSDCKSLKDKISKLYSLLEERGLKGAPSIEKCKKLREKYERKREVEELDLSNIIDNEEETTRGRKTRTRSSAPPAKSSIPASVIKQEKEAAEREADFKQRFSRIKKAFGSSSSDSN